MWSLSHDDLNSMTFAKIVRQLHGLPDEGEPPLAKRRKPAAAAVANELHNSHVPVATDDGTDCSMCWKVRLRRKLAFACEKCINRKGHNVHLCMKRKQSCFKFYHSTAFDPYRWHLAYLFILSLANISDLSSNNVLTWSTEFVNFRKSNCFLRSVCQHLKRTCQTISFR